MVLGSREALQVSAWGWGEGWTVLMSPKSWQRSAPGSLGPSQLWAPSPSCLHPCYLWSPGVSSEFIVNTLNAGSGALSVTIDGPSKVQLDCRECPEGHVVTYTPMAPGNYLIAIKYGGPQHIVGSPFKAKVTGERPGWGEVPPWAGSLSWAGSSGYSHPGQSWPQISVFQVTRNKVGLALHNVPFSTFYVWTRVHHFKKIKSLSTVHPLTNLFPAVAPQVFTELCPPGIPVSGFQEYTAQQTFT